MWAWRWHHDELHSLSEVGEGPAAEGESFVQPEHCLSRLFESVFEGVGAALHTHEAVEVAHGSADLSGGRLGRIGVRVGCAAVFGLVGAVFCVLPADKGHELSFTGPAVHEGDKFLDV